MNDRPLQSMVNLARFLALIRSRHNLRRENCLSNKVAICMPQDVCWACLRAARRFIGSACVRAVSRTGGHANTHAVSRLVRQPPGRWTPMCFGALVRCSLLFFLRGLYIFLCKNFPAFSLSFAVCIRVVRPQQHQWSSRSELGFAPRRESGGGRSNILLLH